MTVSQENRNRPGVQTAALVAGLVVLTGLVMSAQEFVGTRQALACLIGAFAGVSLYHASFGFTSAWRRLVTERRGRGLRAQVLLLVLGSAVTFPLIAWGEAFGVRANGFVFPFGVSAALGAFLFGFGMQFGGGCASGTLFTAGGGSTRMMITLVAFVLGSVWATAHMSFWTSLPQLPALSLVTHLGPVLGWAVTATVLGTAAVVSIRLERRAHGELDRQESGFNPLKGPWPPEAGALALVVVTVLTLVVLGRPWGITSGFALWGAKWLTSVGVDVQAWPYWQGQAQALERGLIHDATSVMNFGILLGAFIAASLAGRLSPVLSISGKDLATAVLGGLLMGYGARLAYGCNIGAYLGGIVSGSLHGWLWLVFGFTGSTFAVWFKQRWAL